MHFHSFWAHPLSNLAHEAHPGSAIQTRFPFYTSKVAAGHMMGVLLGVYQYTGGIKGSRWRAADNN
eukprot:4977902-Karenia_brevis.AAC.1